MWFRLSNETLIEADQILLQFFDFGKSSSIMVDFRLRGEQQKTVNGFGDTVSAETFMDAVHNNVDNQVGQVIDLRGIIRSEGPFADGSVALLPAL